MKTFLFLLCLPFASVAQTMEATPQEEVAIIQAIDDLFEGMKKADSTAVKAAFASGATMQTVVNDAGSVSVRTGSVAGFASQVGKARPGELNEAVQPYQIHIDGDLATAFVPYSFRYKGKVSHCGANAMTLVRLNNAWKIQAIIDTRRKCL